MYGTTIKKIFKQHAARYNNEEDGFYFAGRKRLLQFAVIFNQNFKNSLG
jgi:hypothetical protein